MNNKVAIGLVAAIIILVGVFFALHKQESPAAFTSTASTTDTGGASSAPTAVVPAVGKPATNPVVTTSAPVAVKVSHFATFDSMSLTSNMPRPIITGTSNATAVAMVLDDPSGVGIAGSSNIPVTNGHWSFSAPQALKPGVYLLHLLGSDHEVDAKLTVTAQ